MLKKILFCVFVALFSISVFADDIIYTKDGKTFSGHITRQRGLQIAIVTADNNEVVINKSDILKLEYSNGAVYENVDGKLKLKKDHPVVGRREQHRQGSHETTPRRQPKEETVGHHNEGKEKIEKPVGNGDERMLCIEECGLIKKGYRGMIEVGGTRGLGVNKGIGTLNIATVHGYQFNEYMFLGAGIGANINFTMKDKANGTKAGCTYVFMPVFMDLRFSYPLHKTFAFADFRVGGAPYFGDDIKVDGSIFQTKEYLKGGAYFAPSFGFMFARKPNSALGLAVQYIMQHSAAKDKKDFLTHYFGAKMIIEF